MMMIMMALFPSPPAAVAVAEGAFTQEDYFLVSSSPLPPGVTEDDSSFVSGGVVEVDDVGGGNVTWDFSTIMAIPSLKNDSGDETFNRSMKELLAKELAEYPLRDPLSVAIPMTLIYTLILFSGLLGNISTCIVIARNNYMHTATNYYLFSLAMSDLLLLLTGLPQEIYHLWVKHPYVLGGAFCVIRGLMAEVATNSSILCIVSFSLERFVAIVYPLKSHKLSQLSRVIRIICIIWLVAFCLALPQAAQFGVRDQFVRQT